MYFDTPAGRIIITPYEASDHSSVSLAVVDSDDDGSTYERDVALLEGVGGDDEVPQMTLYVWQNEYSEEYTHALQIAPAKKN